MNLRVLLAESGTEDAIFLREVLTELDGARCWSDWVHVEALHAGTWADTAAILATERVDIVLLDPDLQDSQGTETFRRFQAVAPDVPVILLIESDAISLAERMVRDGAQDFLVKKDVDCAPLARAIRNALERHRLLGAARATSMTDPLTGLLTRPAFVTLAERDRLLAERLNRRMIIFVAASLQPDSQDGTGMRAQDEQGRDLSLVETADGLRRLAGPAAILGRLDHSHFGLAALDTFVESIEEVRSRFQNARAAGTLIFGDGIFDPQQPLSLDALLVHASQSLHSRVNRAVA